MESSLILCTTTESWPNQPPKKPTAVPTALLRAKVHFSNGLDTFHNSHQLASDFCPPKMCDASVRESVLHLT